MSVTSIYTAVYDRNGDPEYLGCILNSKISEFMQWYVFENPKCDIYMQPATPEQIQQEILDREKIATAMENQGFIPEDFR